MYKLFVLILPAILAVLPISVSAANLAPHRAVYDLLSDSVSEKSGIRKVEGRMAYEVLGSDCEGWSVNYRAANRYSNSDGSEQLFDTQMTSWEAGDGSEFRINQKQYINSALSAESKIVVARDSSGEGQGVISNPAEKKFKLPGKTMFPMRHQAQVLDLALKGGGRDATPIFDGSDSDKSYRVVSFIGRQRSGKEVLSKSTVAGVEALQGLKAWPMTMTYFSGEDEKAEEPVFQSDFTLFENGVATSMRFDYQTHTVKAELSKIEILPATPCN